MEFVDCEHRGSLGIGWLLGAGVWRRARIAAAPAPPTKEARARRERSAQAALPQGQEGEGPEGQGAACSAQAALPQGHDGDGVWAAGSAARQRRRWCRCCGLNAGAASVANQCEVVEGKEAQHQKKTHPWGEGAERSGSYADTARCLREPTSVFAVLGCVFGCVGGCVGGCFPILGCVGRYG